MKRKLPITKRYEVSPEKIGDPLARVLADASAADHLGIPFTITTEKDEAFRNGGNVNKTQIFTYQIVIGKLTEEEN